MPGNSIVITYDQTNIYANSNNVTGWSFFVKKGSILYNFNMLNPSFVIGGLNVNRTIKINSEKFFRYNTVYKLYVNGIHLNTFITDNLIL